MWRSFFSNPNWSVLLNGSLVEVELVLCIEEVVAVVGVELASRNSPTGKELVQQMEHS